MRLKDHDRVLADMGLESKRISRVKLPVHNPETGRMEGLLEYSDDEGAQWKAEALRLRSENAALRRKLAALQPPDEERLAAARRLRRRKPN